MDFVRKQTYNTPEQDHAMKLLARRHGITEAEVVRRALDCWLSVEDAAGRNDPFTALIGSVDGPVEMDHDDIYR